VSIKQELIDLIHPHRMNHMVATDELVNIILKYLKSQNVVRLRDNQQAPFRFLHPNDKPNTSYAKAKEDMIKAKFRAVEELE